jgi:hypothetical protein
VGRRSSPRINAPNGRRSPIRGVIAASERLSGESGEGHVTVQDRETADGARVETQAIQVTVNSTGIQGISRPATDGTTTGPLMDAVPQYTAG